MKEFVAKGDRRGGFPFACMPGLIPEDFYRVFKVIFCRSDKNEVATEVSYGCDGRRHVKIRHKIWFTDSKVSFAEPDVVVEVVGRCDGSCKKKCP